MFMVVKKSKIFLMLLLLSATVTVMNRSGEDTVPASVGIPAYKKTVVIDAGHGYPDGGAVGNNGTIEQDINLKIAMNIQSLLERSGANVIVTRSDDNNIADEGYEKIRDLKRSDMKNRKAIRDSYGADIFVSIHMNKFPDSSSKGAQVFYADSPSESKILGECIQSELILLCDPENKRVAKKAEDTIYLLKDSKIPAVIIECGFLSNPREETLLNTEEYRQRISWSVYSGIQKYFEQKGEM